jgi:hypothetical protein
MSVAPATSLPGRVVRVTWLLLAALDGCLLVCLTRSYRLMDLRGDAERASQYREQARLLGSR